MGVVVAFNLTAWRTEFPELSYVSDAAVNGYFTRATLLHANDGSGPVNDAGQQLALLNLVTAHLATLNAAGASGEPASKIVGRISDATQGSVSVSADMGTVRNNQAFWIQTKYGAEYWLATGVYRTMRYLPSRVRRNFNFPFYR